MRQVDVSGRIPYLLFALFFLFGDWSQKPRPPTCDPISLSLYHNPTWVAHLAISEAIEKLLGPSLEEKGKV